MIDDVVSVIIPTYMVEKYISRCIDSIVKQTYRNLEIIFVDDGTNDESCKIIEQAMKTDCRIKLIHHGYNRGLFQARITGVENSTGKYILFVDADDCISSDWIRSLVYKIKETNADMVVGDFVLLFPDGTKKYHSFDPIRCQDFILEDQDVIDAFMKQRGCFYGWHTVWNKLYSMEIWKKILPHLIDFSKEVGNLVMTEDIAFSSLLYLNAKKVVNVHGGSHYCYFKGEDSATTNQNNLLRYEKNIRDVKCVFTFFKSQLLERNLFSKYEEEYGSWLSLYGRIYWDTLEQLDCSDIQRCKLRKDLISSFRMDEGRGQDTSDYYLYSELTDLSPNNDLYEEMKCYISSDRCDYVSFDLFDTLVVRPFFHPTDLFILLNDAFRKLTSGTACVSFSKLRVSSEEKIRRKISQSYPTKEDVTIDEIYHQIFLDYSVPESVLDVLKEMEKDLEIKYCYPRNSGRDLFNLAAYCGKKIIISSDMYLDSSTIEKILKNCGYDGYKLYLSSSIGCTKFTGHLFSIVLDSLNILEPSRLCHIGDNWISDVEIPSKLGIKSYHLCKTTDLLSNSNLGIYSGNLFKSCMFPKTIFQDEAQGFNSFLGVRCAWAVVANRIYDNPYITFKRDTDFNQNPFYVGYCALGMYMISISRWILENESGCDSDHTIHFVARDGYLPKRAFDILNPNNSKIKTNYIHVSRRALLTADMNCPYDLYSIYYKMNILNTSPSELIDCISILFDCDTLEKINREISVAFNNPLKKFANDSEYNQFIKYLIDNYKDHMDFIKKDKCFRALFEDKIHPGDKIFDVGYGGRTEAALSHIMGFPVDSYYIHTNSDVANTRGDVFGFKINVFYGHKPSITGVMREHLMMDMAPSTVGYDFKNNSPIFEKYSIDYPTYIMTDIAQNAAIQFCSDMKSIFGKDLSKLYWRAEDMSIPFEHYLHSSPYLDRKIFGNLVFEDKLGEEKTFNAVNFWNEDISRVCHERNWADCAAGSIGICECGQSNVKDVTTNDSEYTSIDYFIKKFLALGCKLYKKFRNMQ